MTQDTGRAKFGQWLRQEREAFDMSIDDVAAAIATDPRWAEIDRKQWLTRIEAGDVRPTADVIDALAGVFQAIRTERAAQ